MGNRLGSPRKRKQAPVVAAAAASPVPVDTHASAASTREKHVDPRRPTSPSLRHIDGGGSAEPTPEEPDATPRTPRTGLHPWQLVPTALHVVDSLSKPVREEQERQRRRHERLALVNGDPELFFAVHSMQDSGRALTPEDAGVMYTHALLLLEARGDVAEATHQLRTLAASETSVAADAKVHLAQCLLLQDPTLETHAQEIERLLVGCTSGKQAESLDADLRRAATELLVHVLMSRGAFREAREMLRPLAATSETPLPADLLFALAACEHQLADPLSSSNQQRDELLQSLVSQQPSDAQSSLSLALLRTEAHAIATGPSVS